MSKSNVTKINTHKSAKNTAKKTPVAQAVDSAVNQSAATTTLVKEDSTAKTVAVYSSSVTVAGATAYGVSTAIATATGSVVLATLGGIVLGIAAGALTAWGVNSLYNRFFNDEETTDKEVTEEKAVDNEVKENEELGFFARAWNWVKSAFMSVVTAPVKAWNWAFGKEEAKDEAVASEQASEEAKVEEAVTEQSEVTDNVGKDVAEENSASKQPSPTSSNKK